MISFRQFNKSKNKSVLFIHGLFSSSGFWFEHLRQFRDFRIILCDIDYENFFENPVVCNNYIIDFVNKNNLHATISHSFGSAMNLNIDDAITRINICPITYKSRINSSDFVLEIEKKTKLEKNFIEKMLYDAETYLKINQQASSMRIANMINFIPKNDSFFTYKGNANFDGDHFNIGRAIENILRLDELS